MSLKPPTDGTPGVSLSTEGRIDAVGQFGVSTDATATANGAALLEAVQTAAGRAVYLRAGDYPCSATFTDEDVWITGPGRLIHQQAASAIRCTRTLGSPITVSAISTIQSNISSPGTGVNTEIASTLTLTGGASSLVNGDLLHLISQDAFAWPSSGVNAYRAAMVPVHGLGIATTGAPTNGGFAEGATVTGATSGATALVQSVMTQDSGAVIVSFNSASGEFTNGENLQVSGTTRGVASGVLVAIMAGELLDTFTTSPVVRKLNTSHRFRLDGGLRIVASGDVDQVVGSANRLPAIRLDGVVGAAIDIDIDSAWTRAIQLRGCFEPVVNARVWKLPNNDPDNAYGYGVEVFGATEGGRIKVHGRNMRHAFTTNIDANSAFGFVDPISAGVPKFNVIHDSLAVGSISAGFDTHNGGYYHKFVNCTTVTPFGASRTLTQGAGFQNRSFGTVYENCTAIGAVVGFSELSNQLAAPFAHTVRYEGCKAIRFSQQGFAITGASIDSTPQIEYIDCEAAGDGRSVNTPHFQVSFYAHTCVVQYLRCTARKFNGAPWRVAAGSGRVTWIDCYSDYTESPGSSGSVSGVRFDAAPAEANLIGYRIRLDPSTPAKIVSMVRVAGGSVVLTTDGVTVVNATASTQPPFSSITAGSLSVRSVDRAGAGLRRRASASASDTITSVERIHAVSSTSASRARTLPAANAVPDGWVVTVKDESGGAATNNITVSPAGSDTIEGAASDVISTNYGVRTYYSDGTSKWMKL